VRFDKDGGFERSNSWIISKDGVEFVEKTRWERDGR